MRSGAAAPGVAHDERTIRIGALGKQRPRAVELALLGRGAEHAPSDQGLVTAVLMGRAMITAGKTAGSLVRAALIGSLHRGRERGANIWGMRTATAPALS